ncbi:MAG: alpha/beta hydrolase [Actinomycetota bacterium]
MSAQRDRLDPASREPLEMLLAAIPGGFNSIPDIAERRAFVHGLLAAQMAEVPPNDRVVAEDRIVQGSGGARDIRVRIYTPVDATGLTLPGIFYIHGGGMIMGSIEANELTCAMLCETVNAVVISTDYRKAPEDPHPAQSDDCYAALAWTVEHAGELGIDAGRLAIFGGSAGGNLAIAVSLMARDRGTPAISFVMAPYPMLDDRNETPSSRDITEVGIWDRSGNVEAWAWFLGGVAADGYAAPARATDLRGLPPMFIDVGDMDLFRDEDVDFAGRLLQAGNPLEFHVYPGAYHASEVFAPTAELSQRIWGTRVAALKRALHG